MNLCSLRNSASAIVVAGLVLGAPIRAHAADSELLDILLENGVITEEQHALLMEKEALTSDDILPMEQGNGTAEYADADMAADSDEFIQAAVADQVAAKIENDFPVKASHGSSGFRLETRDGNWQTNLQWRAQLRYTNPYFGDPRQVDDFQETGTSNFEARRLRMKIGGHGFQPWLKYYFEVDLQPSRDPDSSAVSSSARVIDWRVDVAKWGWGGIRVGQWKIDMNRERVDSSGRQQFVERSIVNRIFTIDRQVGIQLRGHAFKNTAADLRYYVGVFNGEGRGVRNIDEDMMYSGRLQWNFFGRDLAWRQTDVEYTDKPTGSFAIGGMTTNGPCTRWSSSGCGNLDGFTSPILANSDQFNIEQAVQEFAFKYRGFSIQQEYHRKFIRDRVAGSKNDLTGGYLQTGYFFHNMIDAVPAPLELALRYAFVEEPNEVDRTFDNEREEFTLGANWFFAGHNNKLTLDYSFLTVDDGFTGIEEDANRIRFQWDVSF
ncbi:MAG: OprO/OprP family phosphate-selective porin [Gammaproteobacteria bacterium]|nr:OprO/OprP family phosphate-selective porin [Gammaproteobacteria bacterium]